MCNKQKSIFEKQYFEKNLYMLHTANCEILSWTGSQFILLNSLDFNRNLSFNFKQNLMHLFWTACRRVFNVFINISIPGVTCLTKKGWIIALHNNLRKGKLRYLFWRYKNLNLEFILFMTCIAMDSPESVLSRMQPKHVWL